MDGMDRGMPHDGREHPTEHVGTARSRRAAIDAATRIYLDGGALDMSALAEELGVGRTTLYRWVGNRENLLGTVLAEATVRTFRKAAADADPGGGVEHVLDVMHRFMRAVAGAPPLQALSKREHLLFIQLTMMPGPVETAAARMITEMLETEAAAGRMTLPLPAAVLGQAIVRLCDAHLYANLLGRDEPEIETALGLAAALLGAPSRTEPQTAAGPASYSNPEITGFESLASKYAFAAGLLESCNVLESADCQREIEFGEEGLRVVGQALGAAVGQCVGVGAADPDRRCA